MEEKIYYCPPKLLKQYRIVCWEMYDLLLSFIIVIIGFLFKSLFIVAVAVFILILKAYITEEISFYIIIRDVLLYIVSPKSYTQYGDLEE